MATDKNFVIPANAPPEDFVVLDTSDTDLAVGEIVKMTSNKPEAVSVDESSDTICGVVKSIFKNAAGNVTKAEIYLGDRLKMPVPSSHLMPSIGDPVYAASKSAVAGDDGGVATSAAPLGRTLETGGTAGAGYAWISCHWPFWNTQAADAS